MAPCFEKKMKSSKEIKEALMAQHDDFLNLLKGCKTVMQGKLVSVDDLMAVEKILSDLDDNPISKLLSKEDPKLKEAMSACWEWLGKSKLTLMEAELEARKDIEGDEK